MRLPMDWSGQWFAYWKAEMIRWLPKYDEHIFDAWISVPARDVEATASRHHGGLIIEGLYVPSNIFDYAGGTSEIILGQKRKDAIDIFSVEAFGNPGWYANPKPWDGRIDWLKYDSERGIEQIDIDYVPVFKTALVKSWNTICKPRSGAYRAFRAWTVPIDGTTPSLWPIAQKMHGPWFPGWNKAIGYRSGRHPGGGTGGFYGLHEVDEVYRQLPYVSIGNIPVVGSFIGKGRLRKGMLGCRIENAKVESICLARVSSIPLSTASNSADRLYSADLDYESWMVSIADSYGAKVMTLGEIRELPTGFIDYEEG